MSTSDLTCEQIVDELGRPLSEFEENHRQIAAFFEQFEVTMAKASSQLAESLRALDHAIAHSNA